MEALNTEFRLNDINYKVTDRSDTRYFAELHSTETGKLVGYETGRIIASKEQDAVIGGAQVHFSAKERIPSNESFGKVAHEVSMNKTHKELVYKEFKLGTEFDKKKTPTKEQQ
jgi:hypothetical protein